MTVKALRLVSGAAVLLLMACGSDTPPAQPMTCDQLTSMDIPASSIGLATTGATVTSATTVAAAGTPPTATGEYCKVMLEIRPVDATAPKIIAQVNLPTTWNGKAIQFGGGGYDGVFSNNAGGGAANYFNGPTDKPSPLGQGYATYASDSGHQAGTLGSQDGAFGVNDEAVKNFAGDSLKKTHDAAAYLIKKRYAKDPTKTYFIGGSTGGREALAAIGRWPKDYDGAVAMYPAWNAATLDLQFGRITRALAQPGAYPNDAKKKVWMDAVFAACDNKDGAVDGLVSNVDACNFDPSSVRCAGGGDTGDTCLSDAQISALTTFNTAGAFTTGSGETGYPGFNVFRGADLTGSLNLKTVQPSSTLMTQGPTNTDYAKMPYGAVFWDQWVKYFVTRNPSFDSLTLDPAAPGTYQQRINDLTKLQDVNNTDFSGFQSHGGKLLLMHGLADGLVSTNATIDFYNRVKTTMGASTVPAFLKFYTVPGLGHVLGSPSSGNAANAGFYAAWDALGALESWVENGQAPTNQVVTDQATPAKGRTRPLCEYPAWPKYNGSGDINAAASFTCATQ